MSALQMDFSTTSPRFPRLNSQSAKFSASPPPLSASTEEVAIDYSKSSSRMSPEGRSPVGSPSSVRVPTKGMRKAYPEDQYAHSPQSCQPQGNPNPPSVPPATPDLQPKMEHSPYAHPMHNYPGMGNNDHSPVSSYYPTPPPPPYGDHHNRYINYNYDPNSDENIREYQCLKCGLIFSRESDLHIHYSQDHGYGHNGGGGSAGGGSSSSSSSGSGNLLPNNRGHQQNNARNSNQEMFCDKCQLRFHCLLSFRVHQHEHVLPNVQPHYPMSNSHLLSLSYTCEICGANFMSRESLTDHANAHLYEHVCSESTCGESDSATTNSSEDFYQRGSMHNQQPHHQYQRGYLELESEDNSPTNHHIPAHTNDLHDHHHEHINMEHQLRQKADDHMIVNQGPNIYSPEYSSSYHHQPPHHEISPPISSSKTSQGGIYEPLIVMDNGKRRFQCVICKKYLSSRIAHEEHTRGKHTGDKPYSCSYCGKRFAVWNTYKHHMGTHKGGVTVPLQKCSLCEKRFKTIECLRNHMQREHHNMSSGTGIGIGTQDSTEGSEGSSGGYSCQICGKTFVRKMWRTRHYLSHAGQNCFRCELCSCILPDEQSYRLHHESHKVSN